MPANLLRLVLSCGLFFYIPIAICQPIIGMGTRWSDSFREWIVHTPNPDHTGSLDMRWIFQDDWSAWDFELGDTTATIQLKWRDDPNIWEVHCLGETATARTVWRNDFRRWRITDGTHTIAWQSVYQLMNEWTVDNNRQGHFTVYTYWEDDPREWVVMDEFPEDVSMSMRLALIFLAIYHGSPNL